MNKMTVYPYGNIERLFYASGALHGLLAVLALAASSHISANIDAANLVQQGGQIELFHALAILATLNVGIRLPAILFSLGGALFAFPLYLHGLIGFTGITFLTPIGGTILLIGWGVLLWSLLLPLPSISKKAQ